MPVTQEDLWVVNADASDREKLDKALDYIQTAMPEYGAPAVEAFARSNVRIEINHDGHNNFDYETGVIKWDPTVGLEIRDAEGNFIGVNSAASVLLHEINHALDPDIAQNMAQENKVWGNDAERLAVQSTNEALKEAGEAQRVKYDGDPLVAAPDVTERTMHWDQFDEFGYEGDSEMVWVESDFLDEAYNTFGDPFEMADLTYGMPSIGGGNTTNPLWPEADSTAPPVVDNSTSEAGIVLIADTSQYLNSEFMFM